MKLSAFLGLFLFILFQNKALAIETLYIYHDADYSINRDSAMAMKAGLLTALAEQDNSVLGFKLEILEKNHRGNVKRSYRHMQQFATDENALFMLGGLHSPPYIKYRQFINENQIPLLVPWAAGGPITRYPSDQNSVFRLSIDDTIAGQRISEYAISKLNCRKPRLLLEQTPWGKSNHGTMSSFLTGKVPFDVTWFSWNVKQNGANIELKKVLSSGSDCIILVANYTESKIFLNAMLATPPDKRVPIVSHWGLTGGDVDSLITEEIGQEINLRFIQSCFDFTETWQTPFSLDVEQRAKQGFPELFDELQGLKAQAGFVHAYDLGRLINQAVKTMAPASTIEHKRRNFRLALENIAEPVKGLIKTYQQPFSTWHTGQADAHEALGFDDFCMAMFDQNNQITVAEN